MPASVQGFPFAQIDQFRHRQGKQFDAWGWGPRESPSRVVFTKPILTLRAYTEAGTAEPAVLIIPAPIKRAYIWDLAPPVSVVRQFLRGGMAVYLAQWEAPGAGERELGLADYADRLILDSVRAIRKETGARRVFLAGHSLGGTFAAIFAALHPDLAAGLILAGAPLHFGPEVDALSFLVAASPRAFSAAGRLGTVPGSVLSTASLAASPATFAYGRWLDRAASLSNPQALETHLRVERWTRDELAWPRRLWDDVVEGLYREDRLMRGTLEIGGKRVLAERVTAPLLSVVEEQSAVAPPEAVRPFYDAARSRHKRWLWYAGDTGVTLKHVGMLVGKTAHESLWPEIVKWIGEQRGLK